MLSILFTHEIKLFWRDILELININKKEQVYYGPIDFLRIYLVYRWYRWKYFDFDIDILTSAEVETAEDQMEMIEKIFTLYKIDRSITHKYAEQITFALLNMLELKLRDIIIQYRASQNP